VRYTRIEFTPDDINPVGKGPNRYIRGRFAFRCEDPTLGLLGCDISGIIIRRDEFGVELELIAAGNRMLTPDTQKWICDQIENTPEIRSLLPAKQPPRLEIHSDGPGKVIEF
jgi:hypothetical protein